MPDSNVVERIGSATRRPAPSLPWRIFWFLVAAVLLGGLGFGFWAFENFRETKTAQFFAGMKPPPVTIAVATATAQAAPQDLPGIGTIWAVHQVTVSPEVGGRITKIFFQAGATVKAGDPLIQVNDEPDQGDLLNYKAQARLAQVNLSRARELASRGNGPVANVDTYQSQLDQANGLIAKTQAIISQKLVRAPFNGVLGIRQIDLGQYVNAGTAVVTLTDLDTLYVNFTLPEQTRAKVSVGQKVALTVDAYPGRSFEGTLTTIDPQVGSEMRAVKLQGTLPNSDHLLQPGMFASVKVVLPPVPDVVTVPETAVDFSLYGNAVYVVEETKDPSGKSILKVKRTFVETGDKFDNKVAIKRGIKAGDRVASSGQLKLRDGAEVAIGDANSLVPPAVVPRP